jgi:hypothetical protein
MRALNIYTVTAKDAKDNTGSASFSLTVNVLAPNLANATDQVATIGSAITNITFNNSGGAIPSCTAAPTIAIWFAPATFVILGAGIMPPEFESPHVVIEPSILMAAKACQVE